MKILYKIAELILRIIAKTWRISIEGKLPLKPAVIAFWHGKMLPIWKIFAFSESFAVVSMSKDGEILSQLLAKWNYKLIRGSSSQNGSSVIQKMSDFAENNFLLITPDGPKGPIYRFKAGAIVVSQRKQIPLYFVKCEIKSKKIFAKSWDKFEFPLPFSKIHIEISEKILVPQNFSHEEINNLIENLNQLYKIN
jgi:lysophospholipid acyltransferase (LPLAT)-like uncharacterized protein